MGNNGSSIDNGSNTSSNNCLSYKLHSAISWSSLTHQNDEPFHLIRLHADISKKRKNLTSLAILRKRFKKGRRTSKSFDHTLVLKDFINLWSTREIMQLVEEYEATGICKEFHIQAEIARPSASTVAHDLAELYDCNYVADTCLVFKGHHFLVHKAILCVRCPLFRELLGKINEFGARVNVNYDIPDAEFFNFLLRYLYCGELYPSPTQSVNNLGQAYDSILLRLNDQVPNQLEHDLKHLLETGLYSDAILIFASSSSDYSLNTSKKCRACLDQCEYSCHSAILAARSTFFRNVISRHQKRFNQTDGDKASLNTANHKIRIVLDESIIPRRFARIILHCMYRDSVGLVNLLPGCVCKCSSSSDNSLHSNAGSLPTSYVQEITELYEIGRFLELDSLIQTCEDLIIDCLSLETLVSILKWSEQSHGSPWVKRQALCFLREEFSSIASSSILYSLDIGHLVETLRLDFVQASELEVLQAIIKWGENKLIKRMEEREPNVISQTAHSLKHGLRKKELNDGELRDIISELIPLIRIGHILPPDSETLTNAVKRGLISTLPPYMLGEDSILPYSRGISCWLRGKGSGPFIRPRYFSPYVDEARNILESRLSRQIDTLPLKSSKIMSSKPDTLYMVDKNSEDNAIKNESSPRYNDSFEMSINLPLIEERIILLMKQREQELKRTLLGLKNLNLVTDKNEIIKYIKLRVVREFGLPDAGQEVLNSNKFYSYNGSEEIGYRAGIIPNSGALSDLGSNGADKDIYGYDQCTVDTQNQINNQQSEYLSSCSYDSEYSQLNEMMPDIALATSVMADLRLQGRPSDNLSTSRSRDWTH